MRRIMAFLLLAGSLLAAREYGPPLGARLPAFNLSDQDGRTHSLQSLLGPKGALILFYPSVAQLMELEQRRAEFAKLGVGMAAIGSDSAAILHDVAQHNGVHFPLLSDSRSAVIKKHLGAPYPGIFVLDAKGVITAKYFEDEYTIADLLVHQFGIHASASRSELENKQLQLSYGASNSSVHAGQRIALELDIELKPKMHVYAPGVQKSYLPIEWTIADSPLAAEHEVSFPKPEMLNLDAIGETVPVFTGGLHLVRDITLADDAKLKAAL